jgi:adenylate kinase family enzyme
VRRVVILGPGASGKSTLALRLGEITALPVIELDKVFWQPGLVAMAQSQWAELQQELVQREKWIMEGDLGRYDVVEIRLRAADTILFLDFSLLRCSWRAFGRSHERMDFWLWLLRYRYQSRPFLMRMIAAHAPGARLCVLRNPADVARFLGDVRFRSRLA